MMLLQVNNLSIGFQTENGDISITDEVNFNIQEGEIYGLVGESGCGKTVTALSILKLLPQPGGLIQGGSILFQGNDILKMNEKNLHEIRGNSVSMIYQEPSSALNPLLKIKRQMEECFEYHTSSFEKNKRIVELLERVGFSDYQRILNSYPHELSGGMLQRVVIAMSLLLRPSLIIADEPTTALDVTVQAQIMELLKELQKEYNCSILLITHNLNLIAQYADRMGVMYAGRMVEECQVEQFINQPKHPYTIGLLKALPKLEQGFDSLIPIDGQVPQPSEFLKGCRFMDRCPKAMDKCSDKPEPLIVEEDHSVSCFLYEDRN